MSQRGADAGKSVHRPITDRRQQAPKMYRKKKVGRKTGVTAKPRAHSGGSLTGARGSAGRSYGKMGVKKLGNPIGAGHFKGMGFGKI